uniref:Desmoplakin a n=1 Tax=Gasterosteus aculeatus aculeatus TaxID=481459 RepID=A0AAQ4R7E5_GASAC
MSMSGSNSRLATLGLRSNSRADLANAGFRDEVFGGGNGFPGEYPAGQAVHSYTTFSRTSMHGGGGQKVVMSGGGGGGPSSLLRRWALCKIHQAFSSFVQLYSIEQLHHMYSGLQHQLVSSMTMGRRRGSVGSLEGGRIYNDAMAWISQQKRMIEMAPWGDDSETIEKQILNHNKSHSSIQRSQEVDRAREELNMRGDKYNLSMLVQEWDSLQKMSHGRVQQLRELQGIINEISRDIMWVNEREEEELMFDWGDKNIDQYIPRKQESYSRLMRDLEEKEKALNKLKVKSDGLVNNNHPATDKIYAYMDTLQTQWSWLLQITKCIDVHLKDNAAYSQFFKEANETYAKLQKDHETIRNKFKCDKTTPLENLTELLRDLEMQKERLMENRRQVQSLVNKSKTIVRLRPRNPEDKSSSPVMVQAICDFKQDQKGILKGNEGILKDNSQRSKWLVTGPGGLDMLIPSVCLKIPPPNPHSIGLAKKNEQYYEAIMSIWNQLYINIKSLISWQYCLKDMNYISSLTVSMLSKMPPDEYRNVIKILETHYQEFLRTSQGSEMFGEEDRKIIQGRFDDAQKNYYDLIIQLPAHGEWERFLSYPEVFSQFEPTSPKLEPTKAPTTKAAPPKAVSTISLTLLSSLQELRRRLALAESGLTSHLHVPLGENSVHECSVHIQKLQTVHQDLDSIHDDYLRLREKILRQLEGIPADSEQAKFLRSEVEIINQKLMGLQGLYPAYHERLSALMALHQSLLRAEDIIKVYEARLTEKETTSLDLQEVESYQSTLKQMKIDLEQKRNLLTAMESDLAKAVQWNGEISESFHKCDVDLSKYSDLVGQMSDRWRRIQTQIDSRVWDLEKQEKQLSHYQKSRSLLQKWIDDAKNRQDSLQTVKLNDIQTLMDHINKQKALNTEIKGKQEKVEDVLKNSDTCASSIKDYELQLASYSSGLETLLNIPIKRTMLQSPASVVRQDASDLQSNYIELLTRSSDYYRFLGELLKNMEELKIRNTRIDMLEEEQKRLKDDVQDRNQKNKSLEDALARYKLELSQSQNQLIILQEVKSSTTKEINATKGSLESKQSQLQALNDELTKIRFQLEDEMSKRRLAVDRYTNQQEKYETDVRCREKELDELKWTKIDLEKSVKDKERELERMKILLEEEAARRRNAESDISKVRSQCTQEVNHLKQTYETEIHVTKTTILKASQQKEENTAELRMQVDRLTSEKRDLEEELRRLRQSIAHTEEQKSRAEQEANQQRASMVQETRVRSELEVQLRTLMQQGGDAELKLKEAIKNTQEKCREISMLTFNLEEEGKKRRSLELEINHLKQAQGDLMAKNTSYLESINKLKVSEEETRIIRVELEKQTRERTKTEESSVRLQSRIRELQCSLDGTEAELEKQKKANQEEFTRRKRMEAELERMTQTCREHTTTITTLKSIQLETSSYGKKYEQDLTRLQEALDKSMREQKVTKQELADVSAELKTLKQKLQQEQTRIRELNQRNESLYKTIEEKSRQLNEYTAEIEKLKTLTQNLTKERLRVEEELRTVKQERDELKLSKDSVDGESATQISALHVQLQTSSKRTTELQILINDLTREREKLKVEIDKFQKQSIETSMRMHDSQSQYSEVLLERDSLLSKLKLLEQDKSRQLRTEEELTRIKLTLEAELRNKQRLQDEKNTVLKDFNYMKSQYELRESHMKKFESERDQADRDRLSLKNEIEKLVRERRSIEEKYKSRLTLSEKEASDLALKRDALQREIQRLQQRPNTTAQQTQTEEKVPTIDPSKLIFDGVRRKVTLIDSELVTKEEVAKLNAGTITIGDIEKKLKSYLHGSTCIAGVYDEANDRIMPFYQAMKEGLLMRGTTLELLEAQAASGFIVDPVNNVFLTVEEATKRALIGKEFQNKLLSAERAVTGYKDPSTGKIISLFEAIEKDLIEKGHGIRLLEAQIASGGIIDPKGSHRIDVPVAYKRGYFDEEMNEILTYEGDDTKGFFDPNTKENLTYLQLKERCMTDSKTGLILLPLRDKNKLQKTQESRSNVLRKRRVVIVDPDTGMEMSVREAYHRELIDYDTFLELSEQEGEWEEITMKDSDGSTRLVIVDRRTGTQYDINDCLKRGVIDQRSLDQYRAGTLTLSQFADQITSRTSSIEMNIAASNVDDMVTCSSPTQLAPSSPTVRKRFNSISITVSPPEMFDDHSPVAAIFDTETLEKITLSEGLQRGIVDSITVQRMLEAQACTGGIINPSTGERLSLQDAVHQGIIADSMATKLKAAQKAYVGFEDVKTKRKMSVAEAVKETWLPYEAGQRFLEFQYLTGGLLEPGSGRRITIEEAIRRGWLDGQGAQKLQDTRKYLKNLTCPKTKLKISYKEAMDSCMVEESNGMKMIQASSMSSKGISSPYNVSNPGSRSGSRAGSLVGSRSGSRRGSVDYSSTVSYSFSSSSTSVSTNTHT